MRLELRQRLGRLDRAYGAATGTIGASIVLQVVVTIGGVLAARMLGVTDRGHLATLWLIGLIPAELGTLGLPGAATYFVARDPSDAGAIFRTIRRSAIRQVAGLMAIQAIALAIILRGKPSNFMLAGLLSLAVMPPLIAHVYGLALLQGQERFRVFNVMRIFPVLLYAVALGVTFAIDDRPGLVPVTAIWIAATLVAGLSSLVVAVTGLPPAAKPATPTLRVMSVFGLRSVLGTATALEQLQLDQAIVGLLLSQRALGLYVTAVAFANLPRFIGFAVGLVAYPDVAGTADEREARRRLWRYVLIDVALCGAIAVTIELLVAQVLPLFFGDAFAAAVPVARILVLSGLLQSIRRVLADGARGVGRPALATYAEISSWVVLAPSLVLLVPPLGLQGVAYALVVAPAVATLVLVFGLRFGRPSDHGDRRATVVPLIKASGVADATYVEGA